MKTNTKKNFLKLATMAFVLFFSVNAVNSQILTDYDNVAETVYQTAGKDFRLYVLPDLVYSPSYDAATNANLGSTARWAWSWTLDGTADATGKPAANENYVEMIAPVAGTYEFSVIESNTVILCPGAATTKTVEVIAAPTATITTADAANLCDPAAAQNIVVQITEDVPDAFSAYSFKITELVENIDISDVVIGAAIRSEDQVAFPLATKAKTGTTGFAHDISGVHTYTIASDALVVVGGERTRYTYTLETVDTGVTGTGIVSAISQKSDFLAAAVNGHAFGAKTSVVFVVNPAPVTGPIYHIPNNTNL